MNASVTQTEGVTIHTLDHIASLIACWMRACADCRSRSKILAKCWDLADAYKQVPLSDEAFSLDSYLTVFNPDKAKGEIFRQRVLPFGSTASVTAFLRLTLGLWTIGTRLLKLMWSCYFDDFLSVTEEELSRHTDLTIHALFSFLGWKLSAHKLVDFDSVCKVLGVRLDLKMSGDGLALVSNTDDRIQELTESMAEALTSKRLSRKDGERLRGRLQFASGQLFGRSMKHHLKRLSGHVASGKTVLSTSTLEALQSISASLKSNKPRRVTGKLSDYIHVYVDAAFEPGKHSGVGGLAVSSDGSPLLFFSEEVSSEDLRLILDDEQKTAIQELEMLALLIGFELCQSYLTESRGVFFTDSEAVRTSFLRSHSNNEKCHRILHSIFSLEDSIETQIWLERVPSQSNPADVLSREVVQRWKGLDRTRVEVANVFKRSAL